MFTTPGVLLGHIPQPGTGFAYDPSVYVELIDANIAAPTVCVNPGNGLSFTPIDAYSTASQTLTITNCGNQALTLTGFSSSAPMFSVPSATDTCPASIAANQSCTVGIQYAPIAVETGSATLTISSNAANTPPLPLTGSTLEPPPSFYVAPKSAGSTSDTVSAGASAVYNLSVTSIGGYAGTVSCPAEHFLQTLPDSGSQPQRPPLFSFSAWPPSPAAEVRGQVIRVRAARQSRTR